MATAGTLSPTVADRDAEIAALQTAFDEYIASSRELEDELDAELAKMRKSMMSLELLIAEVWAKSTIIFILLNLTKCYRSQSFRGKVS